MGLFGSKKRVRLYHIEIDDEGIDEEISEIILKTQQNISKFKQHIDHSTFMLSDEALSNLKRLMIKTKDKVIHLRNDINTITNLKLENQQYFIIKDNSFFSDKKDELEKISELVYKFIEIIEQHPSTTELRDDLINNLINDLLQMQQSIEQILTDDKQLREIYKRISEI